MKIYDFKEFLNIDDIAEYLTDKGVSKFYPLITHSEKRLNGLLSEWIKLGKLRPLYPFNRFVMQYKMDYGFEINESNVLEFAENILDDFERMQNGEPKKHNHKAKRIDIGKKYINDYLIFSDEIWNSLCFSDNTPLTSLDWYRFYNDENNKYQFDIIYCDDIPPEHREFTIFRNKVVFLKSELDTIFNQPSKADLENKISMLEQQAKMTNDNYKSIEFRTGGVDTCIYIDDLHDKITAKDDIIAEQTKQIAELQKQLEQMPQGASVDSDLKGIEKYNHDKQKTKDFARAIAKSIWQMDVNQQIRTNDMVQHIKSILLEVSPGDLPERDESLANWLQDIKPPHAKKSGRTPKNAPTEIPLTFKK